MKLVQKITITFFLFCISFFSFSQGKTSSNDNNTGKWFPKYDFDLKSIQSPQLEFGPFARWWWPGNAVTKEELKREINLFADHGFGGVEIQPFNLFIPGTKEVKEKITTWDTPEYYENVKVVMEEARKRGLTVDMTDGSGWPPGGPYLNVEDGFKSLNFTTLDLKGGENVSVSVPAVTNNTGVSAGLVTVLAARILPKNEGDKTKTTQLDPSSTLILTQNVANNTLKWDVPSGNWKVIFFWIKPSGQRSMTATSVPGYVMDHFDSTKVIKSYTHLFGQRTGLQEYFGNPMRAVFDDSYEFQVDRHFSQDFITYFKKNRGYDITPWLPVQMEEKYNYVAFNRPPNTVPEFSFSKEDWRLRFDYDLTLSELFGEHFLKTTKNWLESQGLLHRSQNYGLNLDMIASAGLASIPETENMIGAEANLKIMTSGGHLYNRPIISSESVVYNGQAYTNTPQKIKLAVDKLFSAGVNQIIYHGVPYRYTPSELGPEGWYPFSTPMIPMVNFSANLGEGNIFWKYQKDVNDYISRVQYALRSGKPHADVLIYFPFYDVEGIPVNPEEIFATGQIEEIDGVLPAANDKKNLSKEKWAEKVYPLINQLEHSGITWEWINDESIQIAMLDKNKQIDVRGNLYQVLILANDSVIQLKTAQQIKNLASQGMNLLASGALPHLQPSFLNCQQNDKKTATLIKEALKFHNSHYLNNESELIQWIKGLNNTVKFDGQFNFTRQVQRDMSDGSRIQFIWNKSNQWQTVALNLDKKYLESYWINAENGIIIGNNKGTISYQIPPFGSVLLYASTKKNAVQPSTLASSFDLNKTKEFVSLDKWNLKVGESEFKNISLFDWRTNEQLKFSSEEGIYTCSFTSTTADLKARFYLDLGKVSFTADVFINGQVAGKRYFTPFLLDITPFLHEGKNVVEIRVTPGQLNGFIGKANLGNPKYKQFKGKEGRLMLAGLIGPVKIRIEDVK